jgi:hypothetical protein
MHRPETKIERELTIFMKRNLVHENRRIVINWRICGVKTEHSKLS